MIVWDTLLVSFLLDPSQKCFALGGQHQAKDDAAASYALFRKQAERIGLTKVLSTILLPEANTSSLLETVGLLLSSQPFPTRAVPSWLEKLREGAKKMACRQIFLPKELLKEVSWNPDEMLGGTPKPPVIQPIKSNSEDSNYWVLDIYYVALRAHNNHVEFRRDMIPYWLEQAPGVDAYLKYASALSVDSDTSIRFAPYADNLQKMGSTEALNSAIALLSTDRLLVEVTADNVKEFSPPTRHCQTPQLWQSNDGCTLEYLDAVTWRLDHKAPYWHHYRIISTEGTENTLQLSLPKNNSKPTLISWPDRVFLYPWSSNQFQYWCEVLERFHAIARNKRKRGEVFLLLLTSTTSQNFVQRLQQLLIAIDMGFDAKEHHSLAEQLRRSAQSTSQYCLVTDLFSASRWLSIGREIGIPVTVVVEVLPLHEWWATTLTDENSSPNDDNDSDENDGERDSSEIQTTNTNDLLPLGTIQVAQASLLINSTKLVKKHLMDWLAIQINIHHPDAIAIIIDPRLHAPALMDVFSITQVTLGKLSAKEQESLDLILGDLKEEQREIPDETIIALEYFLRENWKGKKDNGEKWQILGFKPKTQLPAIEALYQRKNDVLVTLPTGEGKSVVFQVPALYRGLKSRRLSIVISPLRALMRDQVENLHRLGFHQSVEYLSGDRPWHEIDDVYQGVLDHRIVLLYSAPERFRNRKFLDLLDRRFELDGGFEFLIIDEAHCVSQWGFEFRPDYLYALDQLRSRYRLSPSDATPTPVLMLSATVTDGTRKSLEKLTASQDGTRPLPFVSAPVEFYNPIREHINISTRPVLGTISGRRNEWQLQPRIDEIFGVIANAREVQQSSGQKSAVIIFVARRAHAEEVTLLLQRRGILDCAFFHAGLDSDAREEIYEDFRKGVLQVLIATKAFGMGMDIPHIHWAIHLSPPSYLEDYLQEVGRIGRGEDERKGAGLAQLPAILLHSTSDFDTNLSNIQRSRIAQPQITELWTAIVENHLSIPAGCLCIVPENGFKAVESPRNESAIRMTIFWLERMDFLKIVQMMPGILRLKQIQSSKLAVMAQNDNSELGRIAQCLSVMSLKNDASPTLPGLGTATAPPQGLIERILGSIVNFFGMFVRNNQNVAIPNTAPVMAHSPASIPDVALINLAQIWRESGCSNLGDVFSGLRQLEEHGALVIDRQIGMSLRRLGGRLSLAQTQLLFSEIESTAIFIIEQAIGKVRYEVSFDAVNLTKNMTDSEGNDISIQRGMEKAVLRLLRASGAKIREYAKEGKICRSIRLPAATATQANTRIRQLTALAKVIWKQALPLLKDDNSLLDLSPLIEMTIKAYGNYREHHVLAAFSVLSNLELISFNRQLVPMAYVLALDDVSRSFDPVLHQSIMQELEECNRLAELRCHAMDIFSALPKEARNSYIEDYFHAASSKDLESFIEKKVLAIQETVGGATFISTKLGQIQSTAVKKLFSDFDDTTGSPPSPNQWKAISHPYDQHLLVNAGPGSGKTTVLVARIVHLIHKQGMRPEEILVLAFNRAVVFEIRSRIRKLFYDLGYGAYIRQLRVSTFHAFATRIVGDRNSENLLSECSLMLVSPAVAQSNAAGLKEILVDEFQDCDRDILNIILALQQTSGAAVMAIGDDDQDILRWNRANKFSSPETEGWHYFGVLEKRLNIQPDQKLALTINFRSAGEIVERSQSLINRFFSGHQSSNTRLKADVILEARKSSVVAEIHRISDNPVPLRERLFDIAKQFLGNLQDCGSVAILCRSNAEVTETYRVLKPFHPALSIHNNIVQRLDSLRHIAAWLDICRVEQEKMGDCPLDKNLKLSIKAQWEQIDIPEVKNSNPDQIDPWQLWELAFNEHSYPHLSHIIELAKGTKIDEFFRMSGKIGATSAAIVSTVHKVKGLEFDSVIVLPSLMPFEPFRNGIEAAAEEARLYYVAMTRAKKRLAYGFGKRERAWWENSKFMSTQARKMTLDGEVDEVWIDWSALASNDRGNDLQSYIEKQVSIGDEIVTKGRSLYHSGNRGFLEIGCLSAKAFNQGAVGQLKVTAVIRYPQNFLKKQHTTFTQQVQDRGWSYVVLVSN